MHVLYRLPPSLKLLDNDNSDDVDDMFCVLVSRAAMRVSSEFETTLPSLSKYPGGDGYDKFICINISIKHCSVWVSQLILKHLAQLLIVMS